MDKHRPERPGLNEEQLACLVSESCAGDGPAWKKLWLALAPSVERVAAHWRVTGRLSRCEDERLNIVDCVMGELRADGFRRLGELGVRLAQRDGSYRGWLGKVAANLAIDYVRDHSEYLGPVEGGGTRWAAFLPLPEALADEGGDPEEGIEVHRILAHAEETLEGPQLEALCQRMRGDEFEEIAEALDLQSGEEAKRLVRSAVERLRARFAVEKRRSTPPPPRGRGRDRAAVTRSPTSQRGTGGWTAKGAGRKGGKKKSRRGV